MVGGWHGSRVPGFQTLPGIEQPVRTFALPTLALLEMENMKKNKPRSHIQSMHQMYILWTGLQKVDTAGTGGTGKQTDLT